MRCKPREHLVQPLSRIYFESNNQKARDDSSDCNTCSFDINDVIMGAMASKMTSVSIAYATVCSGADQRKHQSCASLALCEGNSPVTGGFPSQRASNAENASI